MTRIGFIGLGHMGLPMAINLIRAGHQVLGYDLDLRAMEALADAGGITAPNLQELVPGQDVLITMLQTGRQVRDTCLGSKGLYALADRALHIDCSSIDVESSRELHEQAAAHRLTSLDAPVSGGVAGAKAGTLTFMAGGEDIVFQRAKPLLEAMGSKIYHTGAAGSGQAAKICNNMILGISMIAVSEALTLAEHLGLASEKLFEVVNNSSGQCWAMSHYVPLPGILPDVPANREYQPGFTVAMMLKDLLLSQNAATKSGLSTRLGAEATEIYRQFNDSGNGQLDFSAVIKALQSGL